MVGSEIYIPDYKDEKKPEEGYKKWLENQGKEKDIKEDFETIPF